MVAVVGRCGRAAGAASPFFSDLLQTQRDGDVIVDIVGGVVDELLVNHSDIALLKRYAMGLLAIDQHPA